MNEVSMTTAQSGLPLRIRETLSKITGHLPDHLESDMYLESDLGIDSIKMVELSQTLLQLVPETRREQFLDAVSTERLIQVQTLAELETLLHGWWDEPRSPARSTVPPLRAPIAEASGAVAPIATAPIAAAPNAVAPIAVAPTAAALASAGGSDLKNRLFALISSITGHAPEELDADQFLESDLGIDSIKMVELSQSLLTLLPESRRATFLDEVPMERLMHVRTLRELHELFLAHQGGPAVREQPAPVEQPAAMPSSSELEILHAQYPFIVAHWAVSTCSLCSHVRLQGAFSLEIARRAYEALLARHPALRTHFEIPSGATLLKDYRLLVRDPVQMPPPALVDLRQLDGAQQEQAVIDEVESCVNHEWSLEKWPLCRLFVWRLADDVHEVFFTNHHLVCDGLGNQQVMREFLALYAALVSGQPAQLPRATSLERYRQTVAAMNAWQNPAEEEAAAKFLQAQGKQGFYWNPTGAARATLRAYVRNYRFRLEVAATQALVRLTAALRLPMNTLLVGAYLRAMATFSGTPKRILINIPTSGRVYPGADAGGMVGCFAQNLTLAFATPHDNEDWGELLQCVHAEIEDSIAQGRDRAQIRQAALFARDKLRLEKGRVSDSQINMIRSGLKSNVYLPYIGNTHIAETYGGLRVLDYQAASVTNPGTLDTVIEQFHERLEMTANYDANIYSEELVARLGDAFLSQLRSLAAYQPRYVERTVVAGATDVKRLSQLRQVAEEVMQQSIGDADLSKDLEADLGLDSLERIRIVSRLQHFVPELNRGALLSCRTLCEMLECLPGHRAAVSAMPILQIVQQCLRSPDAPAVISAEGSLSYRELHRQSNQLAHFLRAQGVERGSLVGLMLNRGCHFMVALLAVLKAGGAYVPLDPDYPPARLTHMLEHAHIATLLSEKSLQAQLAQCLIAPKALRNVIYLDEPPAQGAVPYRTFGRAAWGASAESELSISNDADDPMVVLYTSGSTGKPKGVVLAHRGYANRFDWHQELFRLQPGERVAQKTSVCFDVSVWELLWPLQYGGVVCPVQTAVLRDPWQLAQWVRDTGIQVMHFVPSLFGEFLNALEQQPVDFPVLRHLIFSGEALPVTYVRRWMQRFGSRVALTNLYGPTEASIDVTAHTIAEMPTAETPRIPIGRAMPQVYLRVLDQSMRPVPAGTLGELWIGGLQLAQGYLHDPERTAEAFKSNPFAEIPGPTLYRTGDLAVELPDGSFDYRGRADNQVKIRGYRIELGEIETVLHTHPSVREAAVLAVDSGSGNPRLIAWLSGEPVEPRSLREHLSARLPHYMIPHRFDWLPALPKSSNGKIDRNALKQSAAGAVAAQVREKPVAAHAITAQASERSAAGATPAQASAVHANGLLGPAQQWLLRFFKPPHRWAGFTRFAYLQPLDLHAFNAALTRIVQRHPVLRSGFRLENGVWRQHSLESQQLFAAEFYDGTALTAQQCDAQLRQLTIERMNGLQLDAGRPLWSVLVIKQTESRYEICVLGHHMISDMLSTGILFKDLWRLYAQSLAGSGQVDEKVPPSFGDYLVALEAERRPEALKRHLDHWTTHLRPFAGIFRLPLDHQTGENVESSSATERFELTAAECAGLQRARARYGCTLYPLLMAPLYRMLSEWSGQQRVVLSHRTHGRDLGDGRTFFEAVGNFAINYPIAIDLSSKTSWETLTREIAQVMNAVPLKGASYDLVGEQLPSSLYPDEQLTPVRANYLGSREVPASRVFEFRDEDLDQRYSAPDQKRISLIEVFFSTHHGAMRVDLNYSSHFHLPATIRRWGQRYVELVRELMSGVDARAVAPAVSVRPAEPAMSARSFESAVSARSAESPAPAPPLPSSSPTPLTIVRSPAPVTGALAGKVTVVTGAGRGIGLSIATRFAGEGARIVLVSRSADPLAHALKEIRTIAPSAVAIKADVTHQDEVESMVRQVVAQFGRIDILVNNAGTLQLMPVVESAPEEWRAILDANLMSTFLACRFVVPHMQEQRSGKIVNLSSAAGVIGYPLMSAYSAAKHAILGFTKALAEEVKQFNVQVNALCPAFVDTRLTPQAFRSVAMPAGQVADAALFLASQASNGITGESINVFGKQDMYAYGSMKVDMVRRISKDYRPDVSG
jgi:amino acid adenylation domain-containing protein